MQKKLEQTKDNLQKNAQKEIAKAKKHLNDTAKKIEDFAKKNPEKAAMISAGIGAALGSAITMLFHKGKKGKKK